jgi:hypothetical protein
MFPVRPYRRVRTAARRCRRSGSPRDERVERRMVVDHNGDLVPACREVAELTRLDDSRRAAHPEVRAVVLQCDRHDVRLLVRANRRQAGEWLGTYVGDLFVGERHANLLPLGLTVHTNAATPDRHRLAWISEPAGSRRVPTGHPCTACGDCASPPAISPPTRTTRGDVRCHGEWNRALSIRRLNASGQLGSGSNDETAHAPVPVQIPSGTVITEIAAVDNHSLALTSTGRFSPGVERRWPARQWNDRQQQRRPRPGVVAVGNVGDRRRYRDLGESHAGTDLGGQGPDLGQTGPVSCETATPTLLTLPSRRHCPRTPPSPASPRRARWPRTP